MIVTRQCHHEEVARQRDVGCRRAVQAQLDGLTARERARLTAVLALLMGADEALADMHLCLPAVELRFYLLDDPQCREIVISPADLLKMLD